VAGGAVIQIRYRNYINFLGNDVFALPILVILMGCVISCLGFFGCCGAIRENHCMTLTYALLVTILFILELATAIAIYVLRSDMKVLVKDRAIDGLKQFGHIDSAGVTLGWIRLQEDLECCGVDSYLDWNVTVTEHYKRDPADVPTWCCRRPASDSSDNATVSRANASLCGQGVGLLAPADASKRIYTEGCLEKLLQWFEEHVGVLAALAGSIALLQIFGLLVSCCLMRYLQVGYKEIHW
jgi:CD63 antigen